jgi:hypothetical protein
MNVVNIVLYCVDAKSGLGGLGYYQVACMNNVRGSRIHVLYCD